MGRFLDLCGMHFQVSSESKTKSILYCHISKKLMSLICEQTVYYTTIDTNNYAMREYDFTHVFYEFDSLVNDFILQKN